MKQLLILGLAISLSTSMIAQEGIQFYEGTWEEALAEATKEDKLVFVDAYTVWCGPCKWMAANAFPDATVGDFFNSNFINAKIDMEKGIGITLANDYNVRAYPSLLFVNGKGELVHKAIGALDAEGLLALGEKAIDPEQQIFTLKKRYDDGERDPEFLKNYAAASLDADMPNVQEIAKAYLETQDDLLSKGNIQFIFDITFNSDDEYFSFMTEHKENFDEAVGKDEVDQRIKAAIANSLYRQDDVDFDVVEAEYKNVFNDEDAAKYLAEFKMIYFSFRMSDEAYKQKFIDAAIDYFENHKINSWQMLNSGAWTMYENTTDVNALEKAAGWALKSIELDDNAYNNDTAANIYVMLGDKKAAQKYAQKTLELTKEAGGDTKAIESLLEQIERM